MLENETFFRLNQSTGSGLIPKNFNNLFGWGDRGGEKNEYKTETVKNSAGSAIGLKFDPKKPTGQGDVTVTFSLKAGRYRLFTRKWGDEFFKKRKSSTSIHLRIQYINGYILVNFLPKLKSLSKAF